MKRPGDILKKRRKELNLTLQELENSSSIPHGILEALENEKYDYFAAESYYCGFLKNYAENLKLNPQVLMAAYQNVKIIESPLPMDLLTGNRRSHKFSPLLLSLLVLLLLAVGAISYFIVQNKSSKPDSQDQPAQHDKNKVDKAAVDQQQEKIVSPLVIVNQYPWLQDLHDDQVLRFVLDPEQGDMLQPELRVSHTSQGFRLVSLNLDQDYELTLARGKINSLPLRLDGSKNSKELESLRAGSSAENADSYRLDFVLQDDEIPAVLINLNHSNGTLRQDVQEISSGNIREEGLNAKFEAFRQQNLKSVPHAILQASKPVPLQIQLTFLRDSYIRYQWFGQEAQEFPVLKGKQLLVQGNSPLTLWLADVNATRVKVNGQDLVLEAFQNVFIGKLEWVRKASVARLYLTPSH